MPQNANVPNKRFVKFSAPRNGLVLHKPNYKAVPLPLKL